MSAVLPLAALFAMGACSTESVVDAPVTPPVAGAVAPAAAPAVAPAAAPAVAPAAAPAVAPTVDSSKQESAPKTGAGIYGLQASSLAGENVDLSGYTGKVSLVVNVASECGYTRQYDGLQKLHQEFADRGFQVLGFPCNDFGGQEPGSAGDIGSFCRDKFGVTFPMFAKVKVKGDGVSPIYERLIAATGKTPGWNFCKYLVGKDGEVLHYWQSGTAPDSSELRAAITKAL